MLSINLVSIPNEFFASTIMTSSEIQLKEMLLLMLAYPPPGGSQDSAYEDHAIDNPYRYASYEYIEEIGIYDLNARFNNPEIARFVSADPYYNLCNRVIGLYEINVPNAWSIIQANKSTLLIYHTSACLIEW